MRLRVASGKTEIPNLNPNEKMVHLAFFLATHNYDAIPKDGYVQITINRRTCKATPNNETGYAELVFN